MNRIIREARPTDMVQIMKVMEAAKMIMRRSGNVHQWTDGYPSEAVILSDIEKNGGFVIVEDNSEQPLPDDEHQSSVSENQSAGKIVGYFAFLSSPEPTYAEIFEGKWLDDEQPYHVVHRIASYPDNHQIFRDIMDFCFAADRNVRIDTHRDNTIMQHCISRYGFTYCGIIYLASGDARLAYQRIAASM